MQIVRIQVGSTEQPSAEIIGAKAANLARVAALGLPVPPAFVLPVELCNAIVKGDPDARKELSDGLADGIQFLEQVTSKRFGDRRRPLLVSVRSGAARSMPGMLDTILNVGCTPDAVHGLIRSTGNPTFAFDCRGRFLESYGNLVLGVPASAFKEELEGLLTAENCTTEYGVDSESLERLVACYQHAIEEESRAATETPAEQLQSAAEAVYRSWMSERAVTYRRLQRLDDMAGTAVMVQAMVFGNKGYCSGAGVAFSRDPSSGAETPVVEVIFGSQGEDVVSGKQTPQDEDAIIRSFPLVAKELRAALARLEQSFGDVQDVEFTIEDGKLWVLQTRTAKRTPQAAVRFVIDFVKTGRISPAEALTRLSGIDLERLANKCLTGLGPPVGRGTGASSGVAVGRAVFDPATAAHLAANGDPIILLRPDTSTADIAGFAASSGIVTARGGRTAHAALVARQLDKPCVVGCAELSVDATAHCARLAEATIKEGEWVSIDGNAGTIYLGRGQVVLNRPEAELAEIERWRRQTAADAVLQQLVADNHTKAAAVP
jgi:pyruvate,orthophosphate dikinase